MGLNLKFTTDKWLTTNICHLIPKTLPLSLRCSRPTHSSKPFVYTEGLERLRRRLLPLGASGFAVMLQRDWGGFKSEPAIQE